MSDNENKSISSWCKDVHDLAKEKGWWKDGAYGGTKAANMAADKFNEKTYKAPSDQVRDGLVKAQTEQVIQQNKAVQQATQNTSNQLPLQSNTDISPLNASFTNLTDMNNSITLKIDNWSQTMASVLAAVKTKA
jgi:hypothetical protein